VLARAHASIKATPYMQRLELGHNIQERKHSKVVDWMEQVSEEQYCKAGS
jgi:hypothetical protein